MKTHLKIIFTIAIIIIISISACTDKYKPAECNYIINIPDTALKNILLKTWVYYESDFEGYLDENGDGEICDGEALRLEELFLRDITTIKSFEGIQHFPRLKELDLMNCNFDTLSITSNSINRFNLNIVSLTYLDISGLKNLSKLYCAGNNLTALDLTNNINLTELYCGRNIMSTLDLSKNVNLEWLNLMEGNFTSIDLKNLKKLKYLEIQDNQISTIDLSGNISLEIINFKGNPLSEIDFSNNPSLTDIYFGDNPMTKLDISKNQNVTFLKNEGVFPFDTICVWTLPFPPSESCKLINFPPSFDGFMICE